MTNEQIRERCQQARDNIWNKAVWSIDGASVKFMESTTGNVILESLYREAMAAGLERAARSMEAMLDMPGSTDDQAWAHVGWCLAEAQRVKECYEDKET